MPTFRQIFYATTVYPSKKTPSSITCLNIYPSKSTSGTKLDNSVTIYNVAGNYDKYKRSLINIARENHGSLAEELV